MNYFCSQIFLYDCQNIDNLGQYIVDKDARYIDYYMGIFTSHPILARIRCTPYTYRIY